MNTETKRSIFDIAADMQALDDLLFEVGGDVTDPAVEAAIAGWMAELDGDMHGKIDNYCALIREMECRAAVRKEESERLVKRVMVDQNAARGLAARLLAVLQERGIGKIETQRFRVSVAACGGKVAMQVDASIEPEAVPEQYRKLIPAVWQLDKDAIRAKLDAEPDALTWARLLPRGSRLSIR